MKIVTEISEMLETRKNLERPMGLVPTMGALHKGHKSLIDRSLRDNKSTVASIFVNPSQFSKTEDFNRYPQSLSLDLNLLEAAGVDIAFIPNNEAMYPQDFETWIEVEKTSALLEGKSRPGHFKGVATIVTKLFNIVRPDNAYFGQKDAQQLNIIKKLNKDLHLSISIIEMPTIRDIDGLAISSRNSYLTDQERLSAGLIFQALSKAKKMIRELETDTDTIKKEIINILNSSHLISIDYVSISRCETLEEVKTIEEPVLISLAVNVGNTRLIDNIITE